MIMRDEETGSLWQHATGEALAGPLKGQQLEVLPGSLMTLGAWREQQPGSLITLPPERWTGLVPLEIVKTVLEKATRSGASPGLTPLDRRLARNTPVIGLIYQETARAYPLETLRRQGVIQDQLRNIQIVLHYDPSTQQVVLESAERAKIIFRRTWWSGWFEFYPHTEVYQPPQESLK
jgi:hypothetical protein